MRRPIRSSTACVVAAFVATVGLASGCHHVDDSATTAMTTAHARWTAAAPDHYRMTWYEMGQVGTTRIDLEIRDGRAVSVTALSDDLKRMPVGDLDVETVFARLERAQRSADQVTSTYDATLGYPTSVRVDVDESAIDDEYEFGIESFRAL
jgi:hypothetical protein